MAIRKTLPKIKPGLMSGSFAFGLLCLLLCLVFAGASPGLAHDDPGPPDRKASEPYNPFIQEMITQVQASGLYSYTGSLSGEWPVDIGGSPYTISRRSTYSGEPIQKAAQFVYEHFQHLGLAVQYVYWSNATNPDVVAEQPGMGQPGCLYFITAHLDDIPPLVDAPGADDNASGSSGVLLATDILSQYRFDCTLRYALFTGEEQGLLGSGAYVQGLSKQGQQVTGALNLDMIAYNSDEFPILHLHVRPGEPGDQAIADRFTETVSAYGIDLLPQVLADGMERSDHASFWRFGYPALLAIEDEADLTPFYHTVNDRLATLDLDYFTRFTQSAVGTLAHLGGLQQGLLSGLIIDQERNQPLPGAVVTGRLNPNLAWSTTSDADGSYNLPLPAGNYSLTVSATGYLPNLLDGLSLAGGEQANQDFLMLKCKSVQDVDFTFSPASPFTGGAVNFNATTALSSTLPVTFDWGFGDGGFASGQTVEHAYAHSGTYPLALTASNCAGPVTVSSTIQVSPAADIAVTPAALNLSLSPGDQAQAGFTLENAGDLPLNWSLDSAPLPFWLQVSPQAGELDPDFNQPITLTLQAPSTTGEYTAELGISSNDPDEPLIALPLRLEVFLRQFLPQVSRGAFKP
jgi:PKD repeat protein